MNPRDIRQWDTFGPADSYADPVLPRLSEMAPYRFILWNVQGAGLRGNPGLTQALACRGPRILRSYLNAGGQLWICGQQVFSSLTTQGTTSRCLSWGDYSEAVGLIIRPTDFVCDWMGICSGDIRTVKERYKIDGLLRALPTAEAAAELFPTMAIDSSFAHPSLAGLFGVDAVFQPNFDTSGGLDTLYTADPVRTTSPFRRKPVAFRYHDPDPAATSGSIALFGIPLHLLQTGSADAGTGVHGMAKSMLDWFRRHERVTG